MEEEDRDKEEDREEEELEEGEGRGSTEGEKGQQKCERKTPMHENAEPHLYKKGNIWLDPKTVEWRLWAK